MLPFSIRGGLLLVFIHEVNKKMIKTPHWPIPLGSKPIDLGLERVQKLLKRLGNPHLRLPPTIHIAGTNGKGSTLAMIKSILEAADYKVHRYTSPHLVHFNERIELCGKPIADDVLYKVLETCRQQSESIPITFFEGTTVAAFQAFAETPADIVLLETGLGGRLDATNVLDKPLLTIITPISFDHMDFLGNSLAEIAGEKAAIMRSGVPCIVAPQLPEVMEVFKTHATKIGAPIYTAEHAILPCPPALNGKHQLINAKVAMTAISLLPSSSCGLTAGSSGASGLDPAVKTQDDGTFLISEEHIIAGLKNVTWPARLQQITAYNKKVWLDGGHNEDAGKVLAQWAKEHAPVTLICGMLQKKELAAFLMPLKPYIAQLIAVPIPYTPDSFAPESIATIAAGLGIKSTIAADVPQALSYIPEGEILIAGSLYLAGSVLAETT